MSEEKLSIDSAITDADVIKDSLENLFLYLNEIDKIMSSDDMGNNIATKHYKLQQLERYLSEMNYMFEYLHGNILVDKNKIS